VTTQEIDPTYKALLALRERTDLKLKPMKHLRDTFTGFDGAEYPLSIRYYQIQGIAHMVSMKRFLLGDDTGLGKTLESIASLCFVWEKEPNRKAIVLTTKSAASQWVREFSKFTRGVTVFLCRGTKVQREKIRAQYEKSTGPTVLVMGYRTAQQDFTAIQNWKDFVLVADEATVFKNPAAQIHQTCRHLSSQADRVWALTATLIKNNLMEGFAIMQGVVTPGVFKMPSGSFMSKNQFMMYFCQVKQQQIQGGRQIPVIVGYYPERITEFKELIDPYYLGRPKHAVAKELPALIQQELEVDMTPLQEDKYAEALEGLIEVGEGDKARIKETTKLTAISYCQEIVNHLSLIDIDGESPKLEALVDLLTQGDFADEKVIVFSRFKKMIDQIVPRLRAEKIKTVRITGDEDDKQRDIAMQEFQRPGSDTRVICLTAAGTESINLQAAKVLVCIDTPWSAGDFLQLIGRMIRIGSIHDRCYVIHMLARSSAAKSETIDHKVMKVLGKKMNLVEAVLGQRIKGVSDDMAPIPVESEISDLFAALQASAREAKQGVKA